MGNLSSDTLARQWRMLQLLPRAPRKTTARDLKLALEGHGFSTTRRTVERDLQNLSGHFGLVADEASKPFGWSWARDADFQFAPRFTASQSVALLLSRAHLHSFLPQTLFHELSPMFAKAEQELKATGWKDWHERTAVIPTTMPLLPPKLSPLVLEHVHSALSLRHCMAGRYRTKGAESGREVTIHPLGLLVRGPVQYLVCTLFDYNDVRQLALHRLSHTKLLDAPVKPPDDFEFSQYAAKAQKYEPQGKLQLVALFDRRAAEHLKETPLSRDQTLVDVGDAGLELTATVECDETLRWWLRAFGSRVEVKEPQFLRDEMRADVERMMNSYANSGGVSAVARDGRVQ